MINKNLKLLVLGLASLGMVACGGKADESKEPVSEEPSSGEATDLPPVVDGKITVYFEFQPSEGVPSLETWTSPYIDGFFNGWDANPGVELVQLDETNIYYAQIEMDYEGNAADPGYQLCLGYNDASGVGDSLKGVASYSYKSDYCSTFAGLAHPTMPAPVDGRIKLVGDGVEYQTWSKQPVQPIILSNYHVVFDASEIAGAPDYVAGALIKGSFNGWSSVALHAPTADDVLAAGELDLTGKLIADFGDVFANTPVEFCIGPSTVAVTEVVDEYRWESETQKLADGNMSVKPLKMDGDNAYVEYSSKLVLPENYEWPGEPTKLGSDITVTLANSGEGALADGVTPAIIGLDGDWEHDILFVDNQATIPAVDRYVGSNMEFKVRAAGSWTGSCGAEGGNIVLKVIEGATSMTITIDYAKLGVEDQVAAIDYHAAVVENLRIVLANTGDGALTVTPHVAGTINGWTHDAMTEEEGVWTYHVTGTHYAGEEVSFKITGGEWNGVEINDGAEGNLGCILEEGSEVITVNFDFGAWTGKLGGTVNYVAA